jgi:hypothetical protein
MKLNKTQVGQIAELAKTNETSVDDVTKQFEKIFTDPKLASRDAKARSQTAMRMLKARLAKKKDSDSFGGKTEDVTIRVEMKEEPTEFKRKDGKKGYRSAVYCTAIAGKAPFFGVLTLWNDANEINPEMVVGEVYTTKAVVNGTQLSMNGPEALMPATDKLPPMSDVITDSYPVVELDALELNVSEDWNDLKLIKGVIAGAWTITTKNDTMMGFLKIISEEGDDTMVAKFSKMYEQVDLWDDGSLVYVLGQVTAAVYDEETGELQYEASAWGNLIVPIDAFEKPVEDNDDDEDEDFDVEDDDDVFEDDFGLDEDDEEDWG